MRATSEAKKPLGSSGAFEYIVLRTALAQFKKNPNELAAEELDSVYKQATTQLEIQSCVLASPEACDVTIPESLLKQSLKEITDRYPDMQILEEDLERNGLSLETLEDALLRELRVEAVFDKIASNAAHVNELDAQIYYYLHPEKFIREEKRRLRHILITVNPEYPENTPEKALERIHAIADRLNQKKHRFSEQAMKHSECPTAMNGGLLGDINKGMLFPELEEAAFSLREGQLSNVVETEMGYHIVYCEAIVPKNQATMEQSLPSIMEHLKEKRRKVCQRTWLASQLKKFQG